MNAVKERIAVTTVPVVVKGQTSHKPEDAITVPAGTEGVWVRNEWKICFGPDWQHAFVNVIRVNTPSGTRFLRLLDSEVEVQA